MSSTISISSAVARAAQNKTVELVNRVGKFIKDHPLCLDTAKTQKYMML
jgi:hypothetical protein